jgi:hypothetical protein
MAAALSVLAVLLVTIVELALAFAFASGLEAAAHRAQTVLGQGGTPAAAERAAARTAALAPELRLEPAGCYPSYGAYASATPTPCTPATELRRYEIRASWAWHSPAMAAITGSAALHLARPFVIVEAP